MDNNEKNFIEKPYRKRQILLYFVPVFIGVQIALVIFCIVKQRNKILEDRNLEITVMKLLELILSFLIFILEIQEFQYFRNVFNQKYSTKYQNYMPHQYTYYIITLICVFYIVYFIGEILIFLEMHGYSFSEKQDSFCDCNFFGATQQIQQYLIFILYFTGQTIMMYNVYMIYSTLQLLDSQQDNIMNVGVRGSQVEVMVKEDFTLLEVRATNNVVNISSQTNSNTKEQTKRKQLKCLICFSTIKKQVKYCQLPCSHTFHRQCLEQLEKSQNYLLKCFICQENFEMDNIMSVSSTY